MKRLLMVLGVLAMCAAVGCRDKNARPLEANGYDRQIDGPPAAIRSVQDPNIIKDQKAISRQAESGAPAPAPRPAGEEAEGS